MGDNDAINNLTAAYNGTYWAGCDIGSSPSIISKVNYAKEISTINDCWNYGVTLNEDAIKDIVEKITRERELIKITPDDGPEIPKWTGFLDI